MLIGNIDPTAILDVRPLVEAAKVVGIWGVIIWLAIVVFIVALVADAVMRTVVWLYKVHLHHVSSETDLQTQIDNLKRELEEMRQKLSEPQS